MFPSLETTVNPLHEEIRLMDLADIVSHEDIANKLTVSGFSLADDNRVAHLRANKTQIYIHIPQTLETPLTIIPDKSSSTKEKPSKSDTSDPREARKVLREHISNAMKRKILKVGYRVFPSRL